MAARRSFDDVLATVSAMTARKLARPPGVASTQRLAACIGLTPALTNTRFVHVAGTKGKGTTCTFTSHILTEAYEKRVGLFTSPHLFDIRERIQINNKILSRDTFTRYFFDVYDRIEEVALTAESAIDRETAVGYSFFCFMFLVSLHAFTEEKIDLAVVEVGIGGRSDSTNLIPKPLVCGITALGMDHMDVLGDTVERIAWEKAGIMKPEVPCFSAPQAAHPSTRQVLIDEAVKVDARLIFTDPEIMQQRRWPQLKMGGDHYEENSVLAFALARSAVGLPIVAPITDKEALALAKTALEGRSEIIPVITAVPSSAERAAIEEALVGPANGTHSTDPDGAAPQHGGAPLLPLRDLSLFLDGAHTSESMVLMTKWFFEFAEASQSNIITDPASGQRRRVRTTILFYSSRDPKEMLRCFMPYSRFVDKIHFCLAPNPKHRAGSSAAAEQDRENLQALGEAWRVMIPGAPHYPMRAPFRDFKDCIDLIRTTPFRSAAPGRWEAAESATSEELSALPVEDRALITGSVLFVGDVLKIAHDAGFYNDEFRLLSLSPREV